ncbi:DUF2960 domain-containing protein [Vibrio genomosp. F10]|uniref:DUF2960 domain-containing protein n=2 Tax=Vibrio genomosp. F10 TaxID=723171 RepID=A0A1E5BGI2_9VIBR|nr:DUF2960 domain-containing protein [Vibrio genomosp. F10]OEE34565.1 DUF2960 domain-containing protein [Vibrio genomosp. F10 str. ZF-129]OEE93423.1 DUF2960 domain-containing protein [Vibrio genomosp. F10 str. 9ZC157]OEF05624.1 DUF2960 domain-containing protein [Vibrio genomosp. F10 str. 9ZB36]OEF20181.1 DUF2960 domain-containing protein [Vibrio genomosp. F10 str. 9ZD137]
MARTILYTYKSEAKELVFSYEKHRNIHEAVAEAEGIDLSGYLKMEQQIEAVSDTKAVRNYRDNHFARLGFGKITLKQKENLGVGEKEVGEKGVGKK